LTAAFLFLSCDITISGDGISHDDPFDDESFDIEVTSWSREKEIVSFDDDSKGTYVIFDEKNPGEAIQFSFTYTYDSDNYEGKIVYDDDVFGAESFELKNVFGVKKLYLSPRTDDEAIFVEVAYRSVYK
jgi:hypothetical protein